MNGTRLYTAVPDFPSWRRSLLAVMRASSIWGGGFFVQYDNWQTESFSEVECSVTLSWGVCTAFDDLPLREERNHLSVTLMKWV